jgi:hypothetical protein
MWGHNGKGDIYNPINATTWARRQLISHQLITMQNQTVKNPFDGFDILLLIAGVIRELSHSGADYQPFVLHYWDLRQPNIILDEKNNIRG